MNRYGEDMEFDFEEIEHCNHEVRGVSSGWYCISPAHHATDEHYMVPMVVGA